MINVRLRKGDKVKVFKKKEEDEIKTYPEGRVALVLSGNNPPKRDDAIICFDDSNDISILSAFCDSYEKL